MTIPYQTISSQIKRTLQAKFRERVSFDKAECLLYSHDLASPPALIRPLISQRSAEGVVQPQNEEELVYLLKLANQHKIPLTPRGKGTSGYGGAIPRYGGLVIDFSRMNKVLAIDPENLTATTEPGVIWLDLEKELAPRGLALRLYPGSAPSSTVAGWLAQGGSGFGSYAYGWFGENVVCAKVVQPNGKVVAYSADELDMVRDAEGITGFISEITIKVMPAEALEVMTASFESAVQLANTFESIIEHKLKLWSVSFINPRMGYLRYKLRQQKVFLPNDSSAHLATFVFSKAETGVKKSLQQLIHSQQGQLLGQKFSNSLWEERFDLLKIRKLAPSLISSKVAVPLKSLKIALANSNKLKHPLAIEGVILQGKNKSAKAVLLGFVSHDERKISYNLVYSQALSFMKLARAVKGRPCATGIYFRWQAALIIGPARFARLISEKKIIDPQNILNPGKVLPNGRVAQHNLRGMIPFKGIPIEGVEPPQGDQPPSLPLVAPHFINKLRTLFLKIWGFTIWRLSPNNWLDLLMHLAWIFEPLARFLANRLPPLAVAELSQIDDPKAISWYTYSCDQCGFCLRDCSSFYNWESQSQRGRWYLLRLIMQRKLDLDQVINKFQPCSECKDCKINCPQNLPPITPDMLTHICSLAKFNVF